MLLRTCLCFSRAENGTGVDRYIQSKPKGQDKLNLWGTKGRRDGERNSLIL